MGKQLVNVPVVLKAPGKEAGRAQHSHSRAAWSSTATAQPSTQPPRGQTRAQPTSPLLSPWSLAGGHRRAAETPLNMHPQCPLSKASACVQLAWSAAPRPREPEERDLWIQSTWPRACFHCFLLRSPLLLPPLQAPFLTLPALCSAPPPSPAGPSLPHGEHPHSLPASRSQGPSHPISCTMHARGGRLRAPPLQVGTSACQGQRVTMGE